MNTFFIIAGVILAIIGWGVVNVARNPPAANVGMLEIALGFIIVVIAAIYRYG